MINKLKKCSVCKLEKSIELFNKDCRSATGYRSNCKECFLKSQKLDRLKNKERYLEHGRNYYYRHKDKRNKMAREAQQKRKLRSLANLANRRSKRKGHTEQITAFQLFCLAKRQKLRCAISGIKLTNKNISLDHIISYSKGGKNVIENLQFLDIHVNKMKNSHSVEEFLAIIKQIYLYQASLVSCQEKPSKDSPLSG